jgi:NADH-quinone oxidoreductase subunit L
MFTAFLTAFYMFRMYFIVFVAPTKHDVQYVYTSKTITIPLAILAIGAIGAGFLNLPAIFGGNHFVDTWLGQLNSKEIHMSHLTEYILMLLSILVAAAGIVVAHKKYARFDVSRPEDETGLIGNKFYIDEIYNTLFVQSTKKLSTFIDKVVDEKIIDAFIMNSSIGFINIGKRVAMIQNANVRFYAAFMLIGMTSIFIYLYITLGL